MRVAGGASGASGAGPLAVGVPALVRGRVRHDRLAPFRHGFTYRAHEWLVDVDAPTISPRRLRWLGAVEARDHIGSPERSLGQNIRDFLVAEGVPWQASRVLMLANARTFGYVFDPLSVWWCFDADGALEGVVAEVHNTYGGRHAYVVELDERGRGQAQKAFYVSPFLGVFGDYQLRFTLEGDRVGTFVTLRQQDKVVFTASFVGTAQPLTMRRRLTSAITSPFMPQRVALLIRLHGVWLWARRLPVVRRVPHQTRPGS